MVSWMPKTAKSENTKSLVSNKLIPSLNSLQQAQALSKALEAISAMNLHTPNLINHIPSCDEYASGGSLVFTNTESEDKNLNHHIEFSNCLSPSFERSMDSMLRQTKELGKRLFNIEKIEEVVLDLTFNEEKFHWIAICSQLGISSIAEDREELITQIEEILEHNPQVCDEYFLKIIDRKLVKKRNKLDKSQVWGKHLALDPLKLENYSSKKYVTIDSMLNKRGLWEIYNIDDECLNSDHLGCDVERLIALADEESYTMPRGLTREQRRLWAKQNQK
jgi:hypothetical protein